MLLALKTCLKELWGSAPRVFVGDRAASAPAAASTGPPRAPLAAGAGPVLDPLAAQVAMRGAAEPLSVRAQLPEGGRQLQLAYIPSAAHTPSPPPLGCNDGGTCASPPKRPRVGPVSMVDAVVADAVALAGGTSVLGAPASAALDPALGAVRVPAVIDVAAKPFYAPVIDGPPVSAGPRVREVRARCVIDGRPLEASVMFACSAWRLSGTT